MFKVVIVKSIKKFDLVDITLLYSVQFYLEVLFTIRIK